MKKPQDWLNAAFTNVMGFKYGSDERLKEDIKYIGKSPSGIPTYTFKYRSGMDTADIDLDTDGTCQVVY